MRRFLSVFLCVLLLLSALCCPAVFADTTADGFEYTVSGGTAVITGYSGSATSVAIPSSVGGATVTSIASMALNESGLTTITVPDSVTSFGSYAFPPDVTLLAGIDSAAMKYALEENITCRASSSSMSGSGGAFVLTSHAPLTVYGDNGGTLQANTRVHLLAVDDGWATVSAGSVSGDVPSYAIARIELYVEPTPTPTPVPVVPLKVGKATATKSATMYKSNSTSAAKVGTIPSGAAVDVRAISGSWAAVVYGSYKGYVQTSYLRNVIIETPTPAATPTPTPTPTATPTSTPTSEPTSTPTSMPTSTPTSTPTSEPTSDPTSAPTSEPTSVPTPVPGTVKANSTAVTVKSAPIYKTPSTSTGKLTTLSAGSKVSVVAISGSWAAVKTGSYKGYMLLSALAPSSGSATAQPTSTPKPSTGSVTANSVAVPTKSTPVYKSPSVSADKMTTLSAGTPITVAAISGNWAGIKIGTTKGYVLLSALTPYTGSVTAQPASTPKPSIGGVTANSVAVPVKSTPVYKTPSTSAEKLLTLSAGTPVTVAAVSGSWAGIKTGTTKGYVLLSALTPYTGGTTAAPTSKPTAAPSLPAQNTNVVLAVSTPLYKTASTSGTKLMTIPAGTAITFCASNSQFAGIKCNGVKGYIPLSAMNGAQPATAPTTAPTAAPSSVPTPAPVSIKAGSNAKLTKSAAVYKSASTSAEKVTTLSSGTVVNVVGTTGSWAAVKSGTTKGYILLSALTPTADPVPAAIADGATAVTVDVCWLYTSPTTNATKSQLEKAVTMKVLATSGQWAAVQGSSFKGYVLLSDIRAK